MVEMNNVIYIQSVGKERLIYYTINAVLRNIGLHTMHHSFFVLVHLKKYLCCVTIIS